RWRRGTPSYASPAGGQPHGRQHEDHGESLNDRDERSGHAHGALHGHGTGLEKSEEEPGRQHGEGIEAAEERDGHGIEAETVSEAVDQAVVHAEDLDRAGKAGQAAGEQHYRHERAGAIPAYAAAGALAPRMRSRNPNGVRHSAMWPIATAASAISTPTCRSVPATSRPNHDAFGRSGDWGKPAPGSPRSPCRASLTISRPTKFRSRVARTSWTPRLRRMPAASPAQAAPASTPPPSAQSVAMGRGAGTMWSATHVAARPPSASCPSPPMLMTRARKHNAMPTPVRA